MENVKIAVYGAGGFGREVAWMIEQSTNAYKRYDLLGFIDDNTATGGSLYGSPVFTLNQIAQQFPKASVVIAVGNPQARERMARKVSEAGLRIETLIHESVIRSPYIEIGSGSILCGGCVLTTDIVIGQHVQMNLNSTLGHDTVIGDFSTIGPGVNIAGFVRIGKRVFIGAGVVIINGSVDRPLEIGDDAVIGAGSCVIKSLPPNAKVFGNPARPIP
jgi:sugar O-acyltransferase (sialic acid O-acetyltransferase NeuD family)